MNGYYSIDELNNLGLKRVGKNVLISKKASLYGLESIEIDDNSKIDDFAIISGNVKIGKNVHIASSCRVAGGSSGIVFEDFSGLAYGVQVFTQTDDYSGKAMTNPTVPKEFKNVYEKNILIGKHTIVGTLSIIMPGVQLHEGTAIGAMSLVRKSTEPWSVYLGNPAKKIKNRSKDLIELERKYLDSISEGKNRQ
ncbi:transferase [Aliarcobacter cryaerophilus]|uniref:acyltransferase n=1 Tax=Aliarcobacter cryaerophilus TaxID=28198 RepID=UPI0021B44F04|nr:transferase [Aliarcobacter cryaerophilus]MCT7522603.1 transferase [Aliarcobacter cryaerophilus]